MNALLKTRCQQGFLIIYDNRVATELKTLGVDKTNTLPFSQITGVQINTTMAAIPLLSKGYATLKIFSKGNQEIKATMVVLKDAQLAKELIEERLQ
jgi:hypothetical protein